MKKFISILLGLFFVLTSKVYAENIKFNDIINLLKNFLDDNGNIL